MAKRTYTGWLPAKTLNLSSKEKQAAVAVLRDLENGKIEDIDSAPPDQGNGCLFDMSIAFAGHYCGSVGCIAGWMLWHMNDKSSVRVARKTKGGQAYYGELGSRSKELYHLVNAADKGRADSWIDTAKTKHAARALRSFLKTGKPQWRRAMGKDA